MNAERIRILEAPDPASIPDSPRGLLEALGGSTLLLVPGRDRQRTRALTTLIHGNEPSGLRAVHTWLRRGATPQVNAVIWIAAVAAALEPPGFAHRALPGRRDLNRCFLPPWPDEEGELAREALRLLRESNPESLVDLHNNTGHNPPYGVAPTAGAAQINLASLFGERLVHSTLRLGALVEATTEDFPSITIECGRAGDPAADEVALTGLERYFAAPSIEHRRVETARMALLEEPLRVCVRPDVRLVFADEPLGNADFTVRSDVDHHNFEPLLPGVPIGWVRDPGVWPLEVRGGDGEDRSRDYFVIRDGLLETRRGMIPIMMTTDAGVAHSDCLFYVVRPGGTVVAGGGGSDGAA